MNNKCTEQCVQELAFDGTYSSFVFEFDPAGELMIEFELDFADIDSGIATSYLTRAEAVRLRDFLTQRLS
jgi:hypothetical protein